MLMMMDTTQIVGSAIDTGKAIGDVGMMAVTAGFFLVLSGILMVVCFKWFIRLINSMLEDQKRTMEELLKETRNQNLQLAVHHDALTDIQKHFIDCHNLSSFPPPCGDYLP